MLVLFEILLFILYLDDIDNWAKGFEYEKRLLFYYTFFIGCSYEIVVEGAEILA
jgi:hypothetical protein